MSRGKRRFAGVPKRYGSIHPHQQRPTIDPGTAGVNPPEPGVPHPPSCHTGSVPPSPTPDALATRLLVWRVLIASVRMVLDVSGWSLAVWLVRARSAPAPAAVDPTDPPGRLIVASGHVTRGPDARPTSALVVREELIAA